MPSKAFESFTANRADIDRLWQIHQDVAGQGPGRKHDVEVLNRAAILFITACWEAYVEDVAMEAFDSLLAEAPTADKVPAKVRALAVGEIVEAKDNRVKVWDLADAGWKQVLQAHRDATKKRWIESLNTPKRQQVDDLFEALLGLRAVHQHWAWQNMKPDEAAEKLDYYITVRGQIAHRVKHDEAIYKNWGADYLQHVTRLVEKTDEAVRAHVEGATGKSPW